MNESIRNPLHPLNNCFPVLCQFLHAGIIKVDTVSVELAIWLAGIVGEVVIGADDDIVIVNKVGPETVGKPFPKTVIEMEAVRGLCIHCIPGNRHGHHYLGLAECSAGGDDVAGEYRGNASRQA